METTYGKFPQNAKAEGWKGTNILRSCTWRGKQHPIFLLIKPQYPRAGGLAIGLVTFLTGQLALDKVLCFTFSFVVALCEALPSTKLFWRSGRSKNTTVNFHSSIWLSYITPRTDVLQIQNSNLNFCLQKKKIKIWVKWQKRWSYIFGPPSSVFCLQQCL